MIIPKHLYPLFGGEGRKNRTRGRGRTGPADTISFLNLQTNLHEFDYYYDGNLQKCHPSSKKAKGTSERKFLIAQSGAPSSSPSQFPSPYRVTSRPDRGDPSPSSSPVESATHTGRNPWTESLAAVVPCNVEWTRTVPWHSALLLIAVTHNYGARLGWSRLVLVPVLLHRQDAAHPAAGCSIFAWLLCCPAILISLFGLPRCLRLALFFALL